MVLRFEGKFVDVDKSINLPWIYTLVICGSGNAILDQDSGQPDPPWIHFLPTPLEILTVDLPAFCSPEVPGVYIMTNL